MGVLHSSKVKKCAICVYWGGKRKINSFYSGVITEGSEKGICSNPKSSFKNKETSVNYGGCSKFEKWQVLTK